MAVVEWLGESRRDDDSKQTNTGRLLNCYRERNGDKFMIKSVLGMSAFADLSGVFMRAMSDVRGEIYAAHGGKLYKIDSTGVVTEITDIIDDDMTTIAGNNGNVTVAAGGTYYSITSAGAVSTPSLSEVTLAGSVSFIGQRTVVTERDGRQFQWSDVADSTTFDALNFATAESRDDNIIRGLALGGQFWIFGERSIERWYLTGAADEAEFLQPVSGSAVDIGLKEFGLLTEFPNGAFFVGTDGIAYLVSGGQLQPVSSRGVETSIAQAEADRCFYYEDEGHKFCVIRFTDRPAWVYDISSGEWHERAEGSLFDAWSGVAAVKAYGNSYLGTVLGGVYKLTRNNADLDAPLYRRGVSSTLENEGNEFSVDRFEVRCVKGRASVVEGGVARSPYIMLRFSKDKAETWGKERWRKTGRLGRYRQGVAINALGQFESATAEFTMTDPVDVPIESTAFLEVS